MTQSIWSYHHIDMDVLSCTCMVYSGVHGIVYYKIVLVTGRRVYQSGMRIFCVACSSKYQPMTGCACARGHGLSQHPVLRWPVDRHDRDRGQDSQIDKSLWYAWHGRCSLSPASRDLHDEMPENKKCGAERECDRAERPNAKNNSVPPTGVFMD